MKNLKLSILAMLTIFFVSCGDFGDLNIDPNNTTKVAPEVLLTSALRNVSSAVGSATGVLYSQMMSETQYTEDSRYQTINFDFNGWYTGPLADLQHIIDLNTDPATQADALASGSNANQIAVARIMKAYFFQHMTDRWGPLPYTQALQGKANFTPAYDDQQTIYNALFTELSEAVAQIDGGAGVSGDILFGGDMDQWKKFANSVRAIMALRISKVDATKGKAEYQAAVAGGVLDADLMYPYLAEAANQNPWFERFITRTDYAISSTLVDYMAPLNDPRLASYGDEAPNFPGEIKGMAYGIENAGDIPNADISFPNSTWVRAQDKGIAIISRAQLLFTMSEAALLGWDSGDAEQYYKDAIQASLDQWGVGADYATFYAQAGVEWDAATAMELIGNQKWVALYLQGYEGWAEWRRTGYPALSPAPDPLNPGGQIPSRQGYPTSERDLNSTNWQTAVTALGGEDNLDAKMWWDVD